MLSRVVLQLLHRVHVGERERAVGAAEVVPHALGLHRKRLIEGGLHARGGEEGRRVGVHRLLEAAFSCFCDDVSEGFVRAQFRAQAVDQPHAHDVFLVAVVANAALVRPVGELARRVGDGPGGLHAQQRPGAGGDIGRVLRHRDALDGAGSIVGRAEHDLDALVFADHFARLLQRAEQAPGELERRKDDGVVFARFRADHAAGGGVGVLVGLHAAEPVHQILRDHQKVRHALEPPGELVRIELIDRVEGLELDAGAAVKPGEGDLLMHLRDDRLGAPVAVGVAGADRLVAAQQHVVHAPGVDRQALDLRVFRLRDFDTAPDMPQQRVDIPGQTSVLFRHAVGKTVELLGFQFSVLEPAQDVPAGGGADVDG